jgi:hypothetical protein|tara:strand:- start:277 stop:1707 length:1431 start_codon:yes stop_codon:yes gene_type:complete
MKRILITFAIVLFVFPLAKAQDIKLNGTISAENNKIKNVADPTDAQDATTKSYVDSKINSFSGSYNDLLNKPITITTNQANAITANNAKVSFPGFGTTLGTVLDGSTELFNGNYDNLINKPVLFDGQFSSLISKPTTLADYGITDGLAIGATATRALAGNTITITAQQASDIETNNSKISNIQVDWNASTGESAILNKPTVYLKEEVDLLFSQMQDQINSLQQKIQNLSPYSVVAYEGFDYDQGTTLYTKNGGDGWGEAWDNDQSSQSSFGVNKMHYIINSSSSYGGVYNSSRRSNMTYPNLESIGNYLGNDDQQTDIACFSFRNLSETISSGVYYVQFLVQFNDFSDADAGGALNNFFILNQDVLEKLVVRRKNGNIFMAKTKSSTDSADIVDTGVALKGASVAQFVIIQIDYDNNKTSIWVDPELSSFDYQNPSSPNAFLNHIFSFNRITLASQTKWDFGAPTLFDEISVIMKN